MDVVGKKVIGLDFTVFSLSGNIVMSVSVDLKSQVFSVSQPVMNLFHWVMNTLSDRVKSHPPSFPLLHEPTINSPLMPYGGKSCRMQYAELFIYIPGAAFLSVMYVLLCWSGVGDCVRHMGYARFLQQEQGSIKWKHRMDNKVAIMHGQNNV